MRTPTGLRLLASGWQLSLDTSTHMLWHKNGWQCSINRDTGQVCFKQVMKIDTVELMRGPVEEGIE